ncbi:MAG: GNAT family N-acetyltransferase [Deltaproteobacteria bacterium]
MFDVIDVRGTALPIADQRAAIGRGEAMHRELRQDLDADYVAQIERMFTEGAHLVQLVDGGEPRALAVWRLFHTTYCGRRLEVEDLLTAQATRSRGYGKTLIAWLETRARDAGCPTITLHSATHRDRAHRFYFREGFHILAFHFSKQL